MRDIGKMTKGIHGESMLVRKEMHMLEDGKMTRLMAKAIINQIKIRANTMVNGQKERKMEEESRYILMAITTKENLEMI